MMSMQNLILALSRYWAGQGCYLAPTYDLEVGAGTMTLILFPGAGTKTMASSLCSTFAPPD